LRYYGTHGASWKFHWYEFSRDSGVGLPWDTLLTVAFSAWEAETAQQLFDFLARPEPAARAAASALFAALQHVWAAHAGGNPPLRPQFALVMRAVHRLHADPAAPLSVEALAQECGVSARWLRQAFARVLGCSPKHYHTNLRLTQAAAALRMGLGTVAQLAERFGYASPFHFSRAIKAKFGCPPTQLRDGRKGEL
jgi:AraC-like DNA-binding protein